MLSWIPAFRHEKNDRRELAFLKMKVVSSLFKIDLMSLSVDVICFIFGINDFLAVI